MLISSSDYSKLNPCMNYRNCSKKSKCTRKCFPVPLTKPQVKRILESFDRNGDGRLSKQELKSALYYMGSHVPSWRAAQALNPATGMTMGT
ncbi:hypothetical protein GOBAR_DD28567 [Gossypium barbadense]|nr:hypothetical protein GOBAR_DD28567 [Gossypium barbadense]